MQEQQAWTSLSILIRAPIKASQDEGCKKNVDQSWIYRAHLKMRRCESDSISMLRWSMFSSRRRRVGWFKCSCGGGRDQSRGHPMRFCFGTPGKSGGCAVGITGGGGPRRPARFKEPGPSIVPGSNCFALVIVGRWQGGRRGQGWNWAGPWRAPRLFTLQPWKHIVFVSQCLEYAQHPTLETG